jgi:hypothetical protein
MVLREGEEKVKNVVSSNVISYVVRLGVCWILAFFMGKFGGILF